MTLVNRLSWLLLEFVVVATALAFMVIAGAAILIHLSLGWEQVWLVSAAATAYLMVRARTASAPPPPPPPPPPPDLPLVDLERLRRMWEQHDIPESTYRRAVEQATRRYAPPPPLPDPPKRRRW